MAVVKYVRREFWGRPETARDFLLYTFFNHINACSDTSQLPDAIMDYTL
jgi:hypothetical protein